MRIDNIVHDLETTYEVELDNNFEFNELCDGDTCRHSECECWDRQAEAIELQLIRQKRVEVERTYQPTPCRDWDYIASYIGEDPELQRTGLGKDAYSAYVNLTNAFEPLNEV